MQRGGSGPSFTFHVNDNMVEDKDIKLQQPVQIACFSKYGSTGQVKYDKSLLKTWKRCKKGANLVEGFVFDQEQQQKKRNNTPDDIPHPAPLGPILHALDEISTTPCYNIVSFRNNFNKILGTPYNTNQSWSFLVEKRNGILYFDVENNNLDVTSIPNEWGEKCAYAGRYYEQLSTCRNNEATTTNSKHNDGDEYCGIFHTVLGDHRIVLGAEIDCKDASGNYVELKTFRELLSSKDRFVFERYKLLSFWIQSHLVGVSTIHCGFRDRNCILIKEQTFRTRDLPHYGQAHWSSSKCLSFTNRFLSWLTLHINENSQVYRVSYSPSTRCIELIKQNEKKSFIKEEK